MYIISRGKTYPMIINFLAKVRYILLYLLHILLITEESIYNSYLAHKAYIKNNPLLEIPAVQWKLLETVTKRRNIINSLN